ncbi:MAG: adenosyl-hopene transferase HpnH [Actinomycetota bacterium]|nr:adenosyl-hopene transferase HpnH [Actinomycetota bacterium]
MRFQPSFYGTMTGHFLKNRLKGKKRFPLVLMLEPTHRCNLACAGCDRIRTAADRELHVSDCLRAVEECGAPVVAVTGGEPLLYGQIKLLLEELLSRGKYVYLCTNGLLAGDFIDDMLPHPNLTLNFHLDGMAKTHEVITGRPGSFNTSMSAISKAKKRDFKVSTNTTVYKNTGAAELEELFCLLTSAGVDGMLVSPGFAYQSVSEDIFSTRTDIINKFRQLQSVFSKFRFMNTPIYADFLQGKMEIPCTPWGNPTFGPLGWKSPCYLVTDGYHETYEGLMSGTDWEKYEKGADPRCKNCMVHGGYETTVMRLAFSSPKVMMRMIKWNLGK